MTVGTWLKICAVVPIALLTACGGSTKTAAPAPARTVVVTVTPSAAPSPVGMDAQAKLTCSRMDDALNAYHLYGDDVSHSLSYTDPLLDGMTKGLTSKTPGLSDLAYKLGNAPSGNPSDSPLFLIQGFPANALQVRDFCITHGWTSTASGS